MICSQFIFFAILRLIHYGGLMPMQPKKGEKRIPGQHRLFLELHHRCNDNKKFCRMCVSSHTKEIPCKMRFKKLQPEAQRSKICYVSYAIASSNFEVNCNECYTNDKICSLHHELQPVSSGDMCNVLTTFRDVSSMLLPNCILAIFKYRLDRQ